MSLQKFPLVAVGIVIGILLGLAVVRPLSLPPSVKPLDPVTAQVARVAPTTLRAGLLAPTTPFYAPQVQAPQPRLPPFEVGDRFVDNRVMAGDIHPMVFRGRRSKTNGKWVSLGPSFPTEGYIYTAFYDERKSLGSLPFVRVIAVMEEFQEQKVYCAMYYQLKGIIEYAQAEKSDIGAGITRHDKNFKEYILSCHMKHETIPDTVGIISDPQFQPNGMIPVEIPDRPSKRFNFGACVSITYWKQDPHRIVEWLELLRILGVSRVAIYNNSLEYEASRVFQEYDRDGFVEFRQSHNFINDPGELTIHMHMSPVINDCMYRGMYKFKKIIVTDFDELIIPRTVDNYPDMITAIDQRQNQGNDHPAKHYIFRNNYFFIDIPGEDTSQSPHITTLRHRKKIPVSEPGYAIKSIIDPLGCTNMHNHYCWQTTSLYTHGHFQIEVDPSLALNQHYKQCHLDLWERQGACQELINAAAQDDIMLRYKSRLEMRMTPMLARLGLDKL